MLCSLIRIVRFSGTMRGEVSMLQNMRLIGGTSRYESRSGGMTKWCMAHVRQWLGISTLRWTGLCTCCSKTSGDISLHQGRVRRVNWHEIEG